MNVSFILIPSFLHSIHSDRLKTDLQASAMTQGFSLVSKGSKGKSASDQATQRSRLCLEDELCHTLERLDQACVPQTPQSVVAFA